MARSRGSPASSSSEFEFTATKSSGGEVLCPADELFYKGQLLPLQLSPRISMVRALLQSPPPPATTDSAGGTSSSSRDSNGSTSSSFSADCSSVAGAEPSTSAASSARPSNAAADDLAGGKRNKYLSSFATRFSAVFRRKDGAAGAGDGKVKEVIKKCAKKVKSALQPKPPSPAPAPAPKKQFSFSIRKRRSCDAGGGGGDGERALLHAAAASFSGNLGGLFPPPLRRRRCAASCPSSMRSSPSHSGLLTFAGAGGAGFPDIPDAASPAQAMASSMEELQSAIEGAIAHCKNSMALPPLHRRTPAPAMEIDDADIAAVC